MKLSIINYENIFIIFSFAFHQIIDIIIPKAMKKSSNN